MSIEKGRRLRSCNRLLVLPTLPGSQKSSCRMAAGHIVMLLNNVPEAMHR